MILNKNKSSALILLSSYAQRGYIIVPPRPRAYVAAPNIHNNIIYLYHTWYIILERANVQPDVHWRVFAVYQKTAPPPCRGLDYCTYIYIVQRISQPIATPLHITPYREKGVVEFSYKFSRYCQYIMFELSACESVLFVIMIFFYFFISFKPQCIIWRFK